MLSLREFHEMFGRVTDLKSLQFKNGTHKEMRNRANIRCVQETTTSYNEINVISHMKCDIYIYTFGFLAQATYIEGIHFISFHEFK